MTIVPVDEVRITMLEMLEIGQMKNNVIVPPWVVLVPLKEQRIALFVLFEVPSNIGIGI